MVELAGLLVLGLLAQWLAWKLKVPAILPLIIIGLVVGPFSTFFTTDGSKFIDGDEIFRGELLFDVIAISVGLILFEGGLTLKLKEVRSLARTVRNLIIIGSIITLFGAALAAHLILGLNFATSLIFGSLIIVTGPTVIGPILRNVRPNANVNTVLKWEGILIDPIGALVAILIYEFLISGRPNEQFGWFALKGFILIVITGVGVGIAFALLMHRILKYKLVPQYLRNIVVLALVITSFALADVIHAESGLLAVTVMGMILANMKLEELKEILSFKEDLTLILISFLFVMLSSRMEMRDITILMNGKSLMLFLIIIWVLRPISVFLSTLQSHLSLQEKIFISWISPRGIVSAGVASIFTIRLVEMPVENIDLVQSLDSTMILPLTFMVIVGTVVLQGLTAKPLASLLGVNKVEPNGFLFLGANEVARFVAKYLVSQNIPVLLADTSKTNIRDAKASGLPTFEGSLLNEMNLEDVDLNSYGYFLAVTSNTEINVLAYRLFTKELRFPNVYRIPSNRELEMRDLDKPKNLMFNGEYDFIGLTQIMRNNLSLQEKEVNSFGDVKDFLQENEGKILPFFLKKSSGKIIPITEDLRQVEPEGLLIYLEV